MCVVVARTVAVMLLPVVKQNAKNMTRDPDDLIGDFEKLKKTDFRSNL